jgi:hypothetical protein
MYVYNIYVYVLLHMDAKGGVFKVNFVLKRNAVQKVNIETPYFRNV